MTFEPQRHLKDLIKTTFMTWHEGHLSLIACSKIR
jgi:hypothetical protein